MTLQSTLVAQFRRPSGPLGLLAGIVMAHRPSNRRRNLWMIDLVGLKGGETGLELGCGPGLAVEAALGAGAAHVLALDHSAEMIRQASSRNRDAVRAGRADFRVGGLDVLAAGDLPVDAAWMANVAQFLPDRVGAFRRIAGHLKPDGRLAVTHQPRHRGASAADAERFAAKIESEMTAAGFVRSERHSLTLVPVPAVCIIGSAAVGVA
jgi:trans-aconitate methyltransferase